MSTEFNTGVQMSLNGNLEVFPLEEVLRLLARSRKSGCLRVESSGVQGRIYLSNGTLSLATTANDVELRKKLVVSGLVEDSTVRKIELSGSPVSDALAEGVSTTEWADFVREESVEGLYRIRRTGRGSFDFVVDLAPRYPTGQSFDSEVIMSEADRRALEWEDIETVLPRLDTVVSMVPSLDGDESVTLGPATWQILAALGGGSSTSQVATKLLWSEFRTAREMATLVRNGLVTVSEERATEPVAAAPAPAPVTEPEPVEEMPVVEEEDVVEDEVVFEPVDEDAAEPSPEPEIEVESEVEVEVESEVEVEPEAAMPVEPETDAEEVSELPEETDETLAAAEPAADEATGIVEDVEVSAEETVAEAEDTPDQDSVESFWGDEMAPETEESEDAPEPALDVIAEGADVATDETEVAEEPAAPTWWRDEASEQADDAEVAEEPDSPWRSGWNAEAPAQEAVIEATPWGSPVSEAVEAAEMDAQQESVEDLPVIGDEPAAEENGRSQGWWAETMGATEEKHADADNEADRFLESVFSSLSGSEEEPEGEEKGEDETGFGMGLLRRRRLGATARDVDNDR